MTGAVSATREEHKETAILNPKSAAKLESTAALAASGGGDASCARTIRFRAQRRHRLLKLVTDTRSKRTWNVKHTMIPHISAGQLPGKPGIIALHTLN
eukprot:754860-Hanusia_phi.AAC.1